MATKLNVQLFLMLTLIVSSLDGKSVSVGNNAFDSLDGLGCSRVNVDERSPENVPQGDVYLWIPSLLQLERFKAIILEAHLQGTFTSAKALTVFVFSDTAFNLMPSYRQGNLYEKGGDASRGAAEYVKSFTLIKAVEITAFSGAAPYQTYSALNRTLFLNKRDLRIGNVTSGPTKYFCNGAIVIRPNIRTGQHVIHVIDRVLDMPLQHTAFAYASGYNREKVIFQFYKKLMSFIHQAPLIDGEFNRQVQQVLTGQQVTFFLPSDEALNQIPAQKMSELQGNLRLKLDVEKFAFVPPNSMLLKEEFVSRRYFQKSVSMGDIPQMIISHHIISNQVLYTSLVNHNERFSTYFKSGAVVFRKNYNREAVYVTGVLSNGRTVTARIITENFTVLNGVVHLIDNLLGYVYRSAVEEIGVDPVTQNFEQLINAVRKDLLKDLTSTNGVTVFAPNNQAMFAITNVYPNYINNQSLINMVLEMSMLMQGQRLNLMDYNAGYESYITVVSRYNGRLIKVYIEGNDTWIEGGYVKARVVKPDIGVTNGAVHQIDAVFGIPTRDIPYTIFCKDWLKSTFIQMQYVGLDKYMRDPTLVKNQECQISGIASNGSGVPNNGIYKTSTNTNKNPSHSGMGLCGEGIRRCEFTFFVPNGTAIDNFAQTKYGRQIMSDHRRWRWILRRLITCREKIYLDQIAMEAFKTFTADNGEEIIIQIDPRSGIRSGVKDAYIIFEDIKAKIIRSDIGATNGVIHIISSLLFMPEDLNRDINKATETSTVGGITESSTVKGITKSSTVKGITESSTVNGITESNKQVLVVLVIHFLIFR